MSIKVIVTRCLTIVPTAAREGSIAPSYNQVMVRFRVRVMVRVEIRIRAKVRVNVRVRFEFLYPDIP